MGETPEPVAPESEVAGQISGTIPRRRLLIEMTAATLVIGVVGLVASSGRFFASVIVGGIISILNFLWLERSLGAVFRAAADGQKPGLQAVKYFLRYVVIGLALFVIYLTGSLPIVAVILGLASFAFAVVIDGILSIFRNL